MKLESRLSKLNKKLKAEGRLKMVAIPELSDLNYQKAVEKIIEKRNRILNYGLYSALLKEKGFLKYFTN